MSLLLNCQSLSKTYGAEPLFEDISLTISEGDRLGLIGPNGSGKSTFLQILAGLKEPDSGTSSVRKLVTLGYVPQEPEFPEEASIRQILAGSIEQTPLEDSEKDNRLHSTIGAAGFPDPEAKAGSLSGGWRKRLSIARELIRKPDIVLLDEPTNHLDIEGVLWLEKLIAGSSFACVVISHDRYFLENVTNQMAELNRVYPGGMFRAKGSYSQFLEKREEFLNAQSQRQEALNNKVRREIEWLRRGPKARTGKSKARIDAAGRLIDELSDLNSRSRSSTAQIDFTASDRRSKKLIETQGLSKQMGGRTLFSGLNLKLSPGMHLGLVGLNGSGKTTLLRILNGELDPDGGTIERADGLRIVYFDQHRDQLDPAVPLRRALASHGDSVIYRDRVIHINAWSKRFLFRAEQLDLPVGRLSGGERARVLTARLMLESADVLLLDEPTNDLDIPTLEVLEESLTDFPGALVLVTHDRYMLDRVSTTVLGLDGQGGGALFADYSQWEAEQFSRKAAKPQKEATATPRAPQQPGKKRLSYNESREWEAIEQKIQEAEAVVEARKALLQDPDVVSDPIRLQRCYEEFTASQEAVDRLYARWAELEAKQQ